MEGKALGRDFAMRLGNNGFTPDVLFIALDRLTQLKDYYLDGAANLVRYYYQTAPSFAGGNGATKTVSFNSSNQSLMAATVLLIYLV